MTAGPRPSLPATAQSTSAGLPPELADYQLEDARAKATPRHTIEGHHVHLEAHGLHPQADEGPVDLTIYGPRQPLPKQQRPSYPPDPARYEVVVEATLDVDATGRASYVFRSVPEDVPGIYVAVFRRTDFSSRPVARCTFDLRHAKHAGRHPRRSHHRGARRPPR